MPLSKLSRSIRGEIAIVTGAASGMGRATAHLFGDEGARVALIDINEQPLLAVVEEMTNEGYDAKGWVLDLCDAGAIESVIVEIAEYFGGIDILVNNAGITNRHTIIDYDFLGNENIVTYIDVVTNYNFLVNRRAIAD